MSPIPKNSREAPAKRYYSDPTTAVGFAIMIRYRNTPPASYLSFWHNLYASLLISFYRGLIFACVLVTKRCRIDSILESFSRLNNL
jgi:hypothetical protein